MIVSDASWVIALRDPEDRHHSDALPLLDALSMRPLMHAVTLSECLVAPARSGRHHEAEQELRAAFSIVSMDDGSALRWAELRASEPLRLPDAVVLDTALASHARTIATFDERLAAAARRRGIEVLP